jgi:hypothetical protein
MNFAQPRFGYFSAGDNGLACHDHQFKPFAAQYPQRLSDAGEEFNLLDSTDSEHRESRRHRGQEIPPRLAPRSFHGSARVFEFFDDGAD